MPRLMAFGGVLIISLSAIFVRLADASPVTAAFLRNAYALPVLAGVWWWMREGDRRTPRERRLAFASGLCLAIDLVFWHRSIELIGAGLSTVLANTQVVFVGVAAWLLHAERPGLRALVTVPLVFAGVVLISGLGRPDAHGEDPVMGVVFGLLSGLCYAVFLLVFRASNRNLAPAAGPLLDASLGAAMGAALMGVLDGSLDLDVGARGHAWLLTLALLPHVCGWLLISAALPRLPALETSVLLLLQPMATVLWAVPLFGEWLSGPQWSGVALVLGGVGWLSLRGGITEPGGSGSRIESGPEEA